MQLCELLALLIAVLFVLHPSYSFNINCYKCASEAIVMNWGRYLPVLSESESTAERSCITGNSSIDTVRCDGACMLLNVTLEHNDKINTIGVMRDCQTAYFSRSYSLKRTKHCTSRMIAIRKRHYNATYCFCNLDYCNGASRLSNHHSRSYSLKSSIACASRITILEILYLYLSLSLFCLSMPNP